MNSIALYKRFGYHKGALIKLKQQILLTILFIFNSSLAFSTVSKSDQEIITNSFVGQYKIVPNWFTVVIPKLGVIDRCPDAEFKNGLLIIEYNELSKVIYLTKSNKLSTYPFDKDATKIVKYTDAIELRTHSGGEFESTFSVSNKLIYSQETQFIEPYKVYSKVDSIMKKNNHNIIIKTFTGDKLISSKCEYTPITKNEYVKINKNLR